MSCYVLLLTQVVHRPAAPSVKFKFAPHVRCFALAYNLRFFLSLFFVSFSLFSTFTYFSVMPSSAFLMIRTLFLQLLLFSVALSIATPIGIPVRPVIPVHPEPIPARPGSGRPTPGHPNGSEPGSPPPRLGTEPPPQPGPIETIEETISLVTDLLEAFAPDSPDTDIGTNPQKPIDLTQPLLPQLGLSPTQLETSTACLKTCLAPLDTIVGADVCVAQIKGTLCVLSHWAHD